jgi:hypothetical protein
MRTYWLHVEIFRRFSDFRLYLELDPTNTHRNFNGTSKFVNKNKSKNAAQTVHAKNTTKFMLKNPKIIPKPKKPSKNSAFSNKLLKTA